MREASYVFFNLIRLLSRKQNLLSPLIIDNVSLQYMPLLKIIKWFKAVDSLLDTDVAVTIEERMISPAVTGTRDNSHSRLDPNMSAVRLTRNLEILVKTFMFPRG